VPTIRVYNLLTLQSRGGGKGLVDVGRQKGLEIGPCPHVHAGTDVEVCVHKEGEATEKAAPGTRGEERERKGSERKGRRGRRRGRGGRGREEREKERKGMEEER